MLADRNQGIIKTIQVFFKFMNKTNIGINARENMFGMPSQGIITFQTKTLSPV